MTKLPLLSLLFVVSTAALPAQTIYLKLDGVVVPGSSGVHMDEIKVTSFETSEINTASVVSTLVAGKAMFANLRLTTVFNPLVNATLGLRTAMGTRSATAELRFYDGANVVTSKMEMGDLLITSVKSVGADADASEAIELAFSRIRWWATPPGSPLRVMSGWDVVKNAQW